MSGSRLVTSVGGTFFVRQAQKGGRDRREGTHGEKRRTRGKRSLKKYWSKRCDGEPHRGFGRPKEEAQTPRRYNQRGGGKKSHPLITGLKLNRRGSRSWSGRSRKYERSKQTGKREGHRRSSRAGLILAPAHKCRPKRPTAWSTEGRGKQRRGT